MAGSRGRGYSDCHGFPENEETLEFINQVAATGVIVGIGHTDVSPELIQKAVDAGGPAFDPFRKRQPLHDPPGLKTSSGNNWRKIASARASSPTASICPPTR